MENRDHILHLEKSNLELRKMELEKKLSIIETLIEAHKDDENLRFLSKEKTTFEVFTQEKKKLESRITTVEAQISDILIEIFENLEAISVLEK